MIFYLQKCSTRDTNQIKIFLNDYHFLNESSIAFRSDQKQNNLNNLLTVYDRKPREAMRIHLLGIKIYGPQIRVRRKYAKNLCS